MRRPDLASEHVPIAQVSAPEIPENRIEPWKAIAIGIGVAATDQEPREGHLPTSPLDSGSTVEGSRLPLEPPDGRLRGISGWLLLFCIGATILTPLYCLAEA